MYHNTRKVKQSYYRVYDNLKSKYCNYGYDVQINLVHKAQFLYYLQTWTTKQITTIIRSKLS